MGASTNYKLNSFRMKISRTELPCDAYVAKYHMLKPWGQNFGLSFCERI